MKVTANTQNLLKLSEHKGTHSSTPLQFGKSKQAAKEAPCKLMWSHTEPSQSKGHQVPPVTAACPQGPAQSLLPA